MRKPTKKQVKKLAKGAAALGALFTGASLTVGEGVVEGAAIAASGESLCGLVLVAIGAYITGGEE